MARRRRNRLLVPEARREMDQLKAQVMSRELGTGPMNPGEVKFEVARRLGVPLKPGDNGDLKTAEAGKIGGAIGGHLVREMVKRAEEALARQPRP
jgi:Small, acid-soluble spore proteins, alpha/beta type